MKLLFTLALPVLLLQNAQAQSSSRLIAKSMWYNNGAVFIESDSSAYKYTNPRGGDLKHTLKYDLATSWVFWGSGPVYSARSLQEFYSDNTIDYTTNQAWDTATATWKNTNKNVYFYDTARRIASKIFQTWGGSSWTNISRNVHTYGSTGLLTSDMYQVWNSSTSTFVDNRQTVYYHDGMGNVVMEINNTYPLTYTDRYTYTYNSSNKMLTKTYALWNGASFVNNTMWSYTYDGTGNMTSSLYQTYNTTTSVWENQNLSLFSSFTGGNMPQVQIDQTWDTAMGGTWNNNIRFDYTYNSSNQLTTSVGETWNLAGFWEFVNGDLMKRYYYEPYFPESVEGIAGANGEANIFPVPAQNLVNISLKWNAPQAFTITVCDINGSVVKHWSVPATAQYSTSLMVDNLAEGNYLVRINGTEGQIVKQIVVVH